MKTKLHILAVALAFAFGLVSQAGAVLITADKRVAGLGANAGNGLNGQFWNAGPFSCVSTSVCGASSVQTHISNNGPDATFMSTIVDYAQGPVNAGPDPLLGTFLGTDAASLSAGAAGFSTETSVMEFSGFISIDSSFDTIAGGNIDIGFAVGSDDGMRLKIGGVTVTSFESPRAFGTSSGTAEFEVAGLYDFQLIYWENFSFTGVELYSTISGGTGESGAPVGMGLVDTAVLSKTAVPEPGTVMLMGTGLIGLIGWRMRKQRKA